MRYRDAAHVRVDQWRSVSHGIGPWLHLLAYFLVVPAAMLPVGWYLVPVAAGAVVLWTVAWWRCLGSLWRSVPVAVLLVVLARHLQQAYGGAS